MKISMTVICLLICSLTIAQNVLTVDAKRNDDNTVDFFYTKSEPGSFTVLVTFRTLENASYSPVPFIVSGPSGKLFSLRPTDKNKGISYSYTYRHIQAVYKSKGVDTSFVYLLPFEKGKAVQPVEHTNVGEVYLKQARPKGWKSYLFRGENLDSVFAARGGIVINVKEEFNQDTTAIFTSNANQIIIEHPDGSVAVYKGFKKKGIAVQKGDEVFPHSFLGALGNAPATQKKYLSFMVQYLSETGFDENKKAEATFVTPLFLTNSGNTRLTNLQKYITAVNDEVITKEMTRRQKKEYEKKRVSN